MAEPHKVLLAYRHLYKAALRAVQYSKPSRYTARDCLRRAFRSEPASNLKPQAIARTLEFLDGAARAKGIEHKLVKNLLHVQWGRRRPQQVLKSYVCLLGNDKKMDHC